MNGAGCSRPHFGNGCPAEHSEAHMKKLAVLGATIAILASCSTFLNYRGISITPLRPIAEGPIQVSVRRGAPEANFDNGNLAISVSVNQDNSGFYMILANKTCKTIPFREKLLSFEGSDDGMNWITLALIPAAKSELYWRSRALRERTELKLDFLYDNDIKPNETYSGTIEYGQKLGTKVYNLYRLGFRVTPKIVRFLFANATAPAVR